MLKKKILLLGLFLAGSVSGLKAQEQEYEFEGAPAGFVWQDNRPHVSSFAGLQYYYEELQGNESHSDLTSSTILGSYADGKAGAQISYDLWLKRNPEPSETTTTLVEKVSVGTKSQQAYVAVLTAMTAADKDYTYYAYVGDNYVRLAVDVPELNLSFTKDMIEGYQLTKITKENPLEITLDTSKGLNITLWANRYKSNPTVGEKTLLNEFEMINVNNMFSAAQLQAACDENGKLTGQQLFQLMRDNLYFTEYLVLKEKQTYTITEENENYEEEYVKWASDKLKKEKAISAWDTKATTFKKAMSHLYIDSSFSIPKRFTFEDLYESDGTNAEKYKIEYIYGQRHILTYPEQKEATTYYSLLGTNRYTTVTQLGVERGAIRTNVTGDLTKASFDNPRPYKAGGSADVWRASDVDGKVVKTPTQYPTAQMGHITRSAFAMQLFKEENGQVVNMNERHFVPSYEVSGTADYRVFQVAYYDRANCEREGDEHHVFYTNLSRIDGRPVGNEDGRTRVGYDPAGNGLTYVLDEDAEDFFTPGVNVIYMNSNAGNAWTCNEAVFKDSIAYPIYVWQNFNAKKLSYMRKFGAQTNPVLATLPFAIEEGDVQAATVDNNRSPEGGLVKLMTYEGYYANENATVDKEKKYFWFQQISSSPANKPLMLRFSLHTKTGPSKSLYFSDLTNRPVYASPLPKDEKNDVGGLCVLPKRGEGKFYGLYNSVLANQLEGDKNTAPWVYTFSKGEIIQATGNARFQPGRAYILLPYDLQNTSASAHKMEVRFLDLDGNEETDDSTTGIGDVTGSAFKAVGGVRAIEIESGNACEVKIHALDGKLVKSLRVAAGHTSVPVATGSYIVNGTKVITR